MSGRQPRAMAPNRAAAMLQEDAARAAQLMGRYCDGDLQAFHVIYSSMAPRLLGYLVGLVGDRPTAEDLLQHTFLKLHQSRSAYIRGANPVPWMYTIAHRTCLDELRRRRRAKVRISADGNLPREPSANISGAPYTADAATHGAGGGEGAVSIDGMEDAAASEADHQAVARGMRALASLPESQRQAVLLTKIHGRTTAEAANIVGISVGAIKLRAHRGYVTLRKVLGRSESSSEIHDRA